MQQKGTIVVQFSYRTSCLKYTLLLNFLHTQTFPQTTTGQVLFIFSRFPHHEQLIGLRHTLGLQLCQLVGDKVPLEGCILAASTQWDIFRKGVVAPSPTSFSFLSLSDLTVLALLASSLCHSLLTLPCCRVIGCSSSSFCLLLGSPAGCKTVPESRASGGSRRLLWLYRKWTENSEKAVGLEWVDESDAFDFYPWL